MELSSAATLFFLSLISLLILASLLSRSKKRRPPGPWCLPLVGSLHHLLKSQPPQVLLRDLARKHGPVMHLRLGQVDAVVVSTPTAAQEVLRDKDMSFASRPSLVSAQILFYGNFDISFAPYGAHWRELRKLCMVEIFSARKLQQFASIWGSESLALVREVGRGGEAVNLGTLLMSCMNAITWKVTFGKRCGVELQEQFLSAMEGALKCSGLCVGDFFPSLWFVDVVTGTKRRLWRAHRKLDVAFDGIIAECEEARRRGKQKKKTTTTAEEAEEEDLLSVMLRIRDEGKLQFPIGTTSIKGILLDLLTAGMEPMSSTVEWVMLELMRNPEVMAKAQSEIRQAMDGSKSPHDHESHIDVLRYTKMVIKESLRLHAPLPLLIRRVCRETGCSIGGFEVAEGTKVVVNAWATARSPEHWRNAEHFSPERFMDSDADYKGTRFEFLPFGSGRRMCPATGFGLAVVELVVARLLYYFDWSLPRGMQPADLDMSVAGGSTLKTSNHLHLVASPYKVVPMEI